MSQVKVEVEVGACKLENDGSSFSDYSYDICLTCIDMFDVRLQIRSTRTLLDFCDMESRLLKTLLDNKLPPSPFHKITTALHKKHLQDQQQINQKEAQQQILSIDNLASKIDNVASKFDNFANKLGNTTSSPGSSGVTTTSDTNGNYFSYRPIFGGERDHYLTKHLEGVESIAKEDMIFKSSELGIWIRKLLQEPLILDSISFGLFFSPAEVCYRRQNVEASNQPENFSEYSFLLPEKHIKTKNIISKHVERLEVQKGQIVVWRFSSKYHDVGFSVELNGRTLLGMKKYFSSSEEIIGSLEMTHATSGVGNLVGNAVCELKFENKYAKMMAPTAVKYYCRAVDPAEYVDCKRRAEEKAQSFRKKKEALETVMMIFRPRSSHLRDQQDRSRSASVVSVAGANDVKTSQISDSKEGVGKSVGMDKEKEAVGGGGGDVSGIDLIKGKTADEAVEILLEENAKLREEKNVLNEKCAQLQRKIDIVLNFANTNSGSSSGASTGASSSTKRSRRQTYHEGSETENSSNVDSADSHKSVVIGDSSRSRDDSSVLLTTIHERGTAESTKSEENEEKSGLELTPNNTSSSLSVVQEVADESEVQQQDQQPLDRQDVPSQLHQPEDVPSHHHRQSEDTVAVLHKTDYDSDDDDD